LSELRDNAFRANAAPQLPAKAKGMDISEPNAPLANMLKKETIPPTIAALIQHLRGLNHPRTAETARIDPIVMPVSSQPGRVSTQPITLPAINAPIDAIHRLMRGRIDVDSRLSEMAPDKRGVTRWNSTLGSS
jgi:hypothetical protein